MKALLTGVEPDVHRKELWDRVRAPLSQVEEMVGVDDVLVALFKRPEKTAGGVYMTARQLDEDVFQGKVGMVVRLGTLAFTADANHTWGEKTPSVGDWVVFRVSDGWPFLLGDVHCRLLRDVHIRMIVRSPDIVL